MNRFLFLGIFFILSSIGIAQPALTVSSSQSINASITYSSITFTTGTNTLTINQGVTVTVTGDVIFNHNTADNATRSVTINGGGTLLVGGNLNIGTNITTIENNTGNSPSQLDINFNDITVNISGNKRIVSITGQGQRRVNSRLSIINSEVSVAGTVNLENNDNSNISTFVLTGANSILNLNFSNASLTPFNTSVGGGTKTITLNQGRVNYTATGVQNIFPTAYANLGIGGSGNKNLLTGTTTTNLFLEGGTLINGTNDFLATGGTIHRTGGILNSLLGGTENYNVVYPAHTALVSMGNEIPDSDNESDSRLQNLTISNTFGVKASKTFRVDGVLNLNAPNPNDTDGLLDMVIAYGDYATCTYASGNFSSLHSCNNLNSHVLRMGVGATTSGQGDVTGKIRRKHAFASGVPYSYGNANTLITFISEQDNTIPTEMLVTATRGTRGVHADNLTAGAKNGNVTRNAVRRLYQFQRTGGVNPTRYNLRMAYEDSQLNGNQEGNLVTWDHHLPYADPGISPHEHGQTTRDANLNFVQIDNHGLPYMQTELSTSSKYWFLANRESISDFQYLGASPAIGGTTWNTVTNWKGGRVPTASDRGIIVPAGTANPLVINSNVSAGTMEIMTGATVTVTNNAIITITSGPISGSGPTDANSSWDNQGTFNAGTGTVRFTGNNGTISGNANFYNLDIPSGATVVNSSSSEISIANSATVAGTWNTTQNDNTVVYNGTAQTIGHPTYHTLRLAGSGNHNLPATTNINGNLTVNNASVAFTGKTLNFAGTGTQTINGTNPPASLETVVVNKSAGTLSTDANIAVSNLTLTNGTFSVNPSRSLRLTNAVSRTNGHIGGTGTVIFEGPNTIADNLFNDNTAPNNITINRNTTDFTVPNNFTIQGNLRLQQGTVAIGNGRINLEGGVVKDTDDTGLLDVKEATLGLGGSLSQNIGAEVFVDNEVKIIEKNGSGSANFLGATTITELLSPNQGAINSNGNLRFRSTNSKTAFVGPVGLGASVNGNVTVERFFPPRRAWRFFSVPVNGGSIRSNWMEGVNNTVIVTNANNIPANNFNPNPGFGTHITGASGGGFDVTATNNPSLFTFTGNNWAAVTNVNTTNIEAGKAYRLLVRGDRSIPLINGATPTATTIRSRGTMVNGNVSAFGINGDANAFTFIGNPYQAPIDMFEFLRTADGGNLLNNTFYVWDPLAASLGAYVTISFNRDMNGNFSSLTTSNASSAAGRYLQPGQAVFVQTNSVGGSSSLSLNQNHKAVSQGVNNLFRQNMNETLSGQYTLSLVMFNSNELSVGNMARDGFNIRFGEQFSNDFVEGEDAIKFANMDEDVAIQKEGTQLSIERRNFPTDGEFIQLHNAKYRGTNYTYKLHFDGIPGVDAFLLDQFTQTMTPIAVGQDTFYEFTVATSNTATTAANRFRIVFNGEVLSAPSEKLDLFSLYPNPASDVFYVRTNSNVKTTVKAVNTLGQVVFETETEPLQNVIELNASGWQTGMYMISVTQNGNTQTQKLVVKH